MNSVITAYLAGAMEAVSDRGLGWRLEYAEKLNILGIKSIVPNKLEAGLIQDSFDMVSMKEKNFGEYQKIIRKAMRIDIPMVIDSDLLICRYMGENIGGTIAEATIAHLLGKPCFLITNIPHRNINGWFLSCFDVVTDTFEDLLPIISKWSNNRS